MTCICPVCGQTKPEGAQACSRCKTMFVAKGAVSVPPRIEEETRVDISDPETRKALEELTMIPGVTRAGALALYKRGIRSIEDFTTRVFKGDAKGEQVGRMIANRIILAHSKQEARRERLMRCPECDSPVPAAAKECGVCGSAVLSIVTRADAMALGAQVSEAVEEILGELGEDPELAALPEEMKAQIAAVLASDIEVSEADARAIAASISDLPGEFSTLLDDLADIKGEKPFPHPQKDTLLDKDKKRRSILLQRMEKWRKMGFDVSELEPLVDGDFEEFKAKARVVLSRGKAKKLEAYRKQIAVWRSKGFNVEGLEELLEKDVEEFKRRASELFACKSAQKGVT